MDVDVRPQQSVFSESMMRQPDALHDLHPVVSALYRELEKQFAVPESFKLSILKLRIELTLLVTIFVPLKKQEWLKKLE